MPVQRKIDYQVEAGVSAYVQIKDKAGCCLFEKRCGSEEEVNVFIEQYGTSRTGWSLIQGAVMPLRTESRKALAEDLFLPTFIHFALQIDNFILQLIGSLVAIAIDLATLPIRCVLLPLRMYYNSQHPEAKHPILELIEYNPKAERALNDQYVDLCYEIEDVTISPTAEDIRRYAEEIAHQSILKGVLHVALQTLPGGAVSDYSASRLNVGYHKTRGEWYMGGVGEVGSTSSGYAC